MMNDKSEKGQGIIYLKHWNFSMPKKYSVLGVSCDFSKITEQAMLHYKFRPLLWLSVTKAKSRKERKFSRTTVQSWASSYMNTIHAVLDVFHSWCFFQPLQTNSPNAIFSPTPIWLPFVFPYISKKDDAHYMTTCTCTRVLSELGTLLCTSCDREIGTLSGQQLGFSSHNTSRYIANKPFPLIYSIRRGSPHPLWSPVHEMLNKFLLQILFNNYSLCVYKVWVILLRNVMCDGNKIFLGKQQGRPLLIFFSLKERKYLHITKPQAQGETEKSLIDRD